MRIRADYDLRDTLANVGVSVGSIFFWGSFSWVLFGGRLLCLPPQAFDVPFSWWSFLIAFVAEDFVLLVASHQPPLALVLGVARGSSLEPALQSVDEPAAELDLAVQRTHPAQRAARLYRISPSHVGLAFSLNLLYQFWIHTEAIDRMPRWFEWLLNTPSHHRVHHASNPRYLDANYAGVFMIWDRLFGSFVPEQAEEPARYGIVKNLGTFNPSHRAARIRGHCA